MEFVVDEVALAARTSRVAASHRLDLAQDLTGSLPQVFTALQAGDIDLVRARIIAEGTASLDREVRVAVAAAVLGRAAGLTPSAVRAAVARAVHIVDPSGVEDRHTADLADRRVVLIPRDNGMSELCAFLPADGAAAFMATLHRLAEVGHSPAGRAAGDRRTADQRRADALVDLATGYLDTHPGLHPTDQATADQAGTTGHSGPADQATGTTEAGSAGRDGPRLRRPSPRRPPAWAQVQVVLPASLLTGAGPEPAELLGYGPIPTSMAFRIPRPTPSGNDCSPTRCPAPYSTSAPAATPHRRPWPNTA